MSDTAPNATLTPKSYNIISVWLHWLIAGLIIFMVFLGWRIDPHNAHVVTIVFWHKSTGILILLLSLARIVVRLMYKAPPEPPMPVWQAWAAKGLHILFYVAMIGMPLTGWAMVSTSAREIPFFFMHWPHMPFIPVSAVAESPTHEFFEFFHKLGAKILIYGMIPLHVIAALKHQFVDKDEVVEHMVPGLKPEPILNWRWVIPIGVVGVAIAAAELIGAGGSTSAPPKPPESSPPAMASAAASDATSMSSAASSAVSSATSSSASSSSATAAVTQWSVDKAATKINWTTTFQGESITGGFGGYSAQIAFDPDQLDKSHVKVSIDLTSVASGDNDRDTTLKGDQFFNTPSFPKATYEADKFSKADATHFVAHGKLSLHGVSKPLDLPFTLTIAGKDATMSGSADLDRTAFGVGSGDYASTDAIPAKVKVDITLKAHASTEKTAAGKVK